MMMSLSPQSSPGGRTDASIARRRLDDALDRSIMFLRAVSRRSSTRAWTRGGGAVARRGGSTEAVSAASAAKTAAPVWTGDADDADHEALAGRVFARYGNPEAVTFAHRGILNDVKGEVRDS